MNEARRCRMVRESMAATEEGVQGSMTYLRAVAVEAVEVKEVKVNEGKSSKENGLYLWSPLKSNHVILNESRWMALTQRTRFTWTKHSATKFTWVQHTLSPDFIVI